MTHIEYDNRMKQLDDEKRSAMAPIRSKREEIMADIRYVDEEILRLRMRKNNRKQELDMLDSKARSIKEDYNIRKHEVYLERPQCQLLQEGGDV